MTSKRRMRMAPVTDRARRGAVPVDIYRVGGTRMKDKKDLAIMKAFGSLLFFSFLFAVTRAFPYPIKEKAGRLTKGIDRLRPDLMEPSRTH